MPEPANREREIFDAALACATPAERAAYLDRACGDDAALRALVDELLRAHDEAGGFFGETMVAEGSPVAGVDDSGPASPRKAAMEGPGTRIDRYRILERIGEGGFGVVYMAEQEAPVRRRVALKIIKLGMDTRAVVARFEAERQALAMMDHPNIAKVFDGGATETGRPYFVMDLVRGVSLTTYCDEHRLTMRERIDLFMQVCHAVQHAHQKGIIHRDLKPSNILVTLHDDRPVPKVIDFGIAKATEQRLTEKTLFTRFHQFIGTPAYMSPEQTGFSELDVDTRSDIYSLGVLLYELLAGRTPFDQRSLFQAGLDELHRTIREKDPPLPSNRVASLSREEQSTTAQRRRLEPTRLASQLRGDLDQVVMKCLEKDRARRYETASGLAMDLRRFLDDLPVLAQPATLTCRLVKFARRHARGVVTTAVVVVLLGSLVVFHTARLAAERDRARYEADKAARVTQLLTDLLTESDPYRTPAGREPTVRGVLDAGADRIKQELADQPELQAEMFSVVGTVYLRLGLHDKAQPLLEQALATKRRSEIGDEHVARILNSLGVLRRERGDFDEAAALLNEALAVRRRLDPGSNDTATALVELGRAYMDQGKLDEAEPLFREALAIRRRVLGEENEDTAVSYGDLGILLLRRDDFAAAEPLFREALAINRKVLGDDPNVAGAMTNLAQVLSNRGDFAGAEALQRESLVMFRRHLGDKHWRVANVLNNLSHTLREQGEYDQATAALNEAMAIVEVSPGRESPLYAAILASLARVCFDRGDFPQAESLLREVLPMQERVYLENHPRTARTKSLLGAVLTRREQFAEAETLLLGARAGLKGNSGPEARFARENRAWLVALYDAWGRPEEAARYREPDPQ